MATNDSTRQAGTHEQSSTKNTNTQQEKTGTGTQVAQSDRQRPIESGREDSADRGGTSVTRHRGRGTPVYGRSSSPFGLMQRMADDMDRLFEQFGFGRPGLGLTPLSGGLFDDDLWSDRGMQSSNTGWTPQVETFRRGDNLVIRADIPGVKKEDVHVEIENDMLTISGERREQHEEDRDGFYRSERSYGQFYRAIPLPQGVNTEKCDASFRDGVLEVTLPAPQQEEQRAKRIQIK
jgi:HSP20 family protein